MLHRADPVLVSPTGNLRVKLPDETAGEVRRPLVPGVDQ
jgi:hypothetical protein